MISFKSNKIAKQNLRLKCKIKWQNKTWEDLPRCKDQRALQRQQSSLQSSKARPCCTSSVYLCYSLFYQFIVWSCMQLYEWLEKKSCFTLIAYFDYSFANTYYFFIRTVFKFLSTTAMRSSIERSMSDCQCCSLTYCFRLS